MMTNDEFQDFRHRALAALRLRRRELTSEHRIFVHPHTLAEIKLRATADAGPAILTPESDRTFLGLIVETDRNLATNAFEVRAQRDA